MFQTNIIKWYNLSGISCILRDVWQFLDSVTGKLDELDEGKHPYQEKEPLPPWPDNTNPVTGEVGGPRGPEPTRYGDWERKGRVSDF
jgi:hypothetical protein